jgi:hypothetical protein
VIDASWHALVDALRLELIRMIENQQPKAVDTRDFSWAV